MKTLVGIAVAAALSVGAAHATIVAPGAGTGEIIEFVIDNTNGDVYARGTQVSETSVLPASAVLSASNYASASLPVSTGYSFPTIAPDANLTAFLAQDSGHDTFSYALIGAGQNTGGATGQAPGASVVEFTSTGTLAASTLTPSPSSTLASAVTSVGGDITTINGSIPAGAGTSGPVAALSSSSQFTALYNLAVGTVAAIGTDQNLYAFTNDGAKTATSQVYQAGQVVLTANGTLEAVGGTAPVPLPAAVWLLGSGLLGLAGVGRRRKV